ncbi:thiamine phosphate synthase [Sphingomonas cavernae]|nr:thiamine phosphate synthase [Sphingomonas cavernae]
MTDERLGDALFPAITALPRGAGIVFRHYTLAAGERRALFERVRRIARRKGLVLVLAGPPSLARAWRADGFHGRERGGGNLIHTAPAHNAAELARAARNGADLIFVSPVHATRSHPGAAALGPARFAALLRRAARPVIALGGMDPRRARATKRLGAYGWGAIDGLTPR